MEHRVRGEFFLHGFAAVPDNLRVKRIKTDSQWLLKSDSSATVRRISHSSTLLWPIPVPRAQPTLTARRILSYKGILLRKHLQGGVAKGALTQAQAHEKFAAWKAQQDEKIAAKKTGLKNEAIAKAKEAKAAEAKVNEARAEAIAKKKAEAEEAARKAAEEAAAAAAEAVETPAE